LKDTLTDGLTVTIEGMPGAELIEFWPDMVRAHNRKKAEKQARDEAADLQKKTTDQQSTQDKKTETDAK
jgi:hypothetical protein